MISSTRARAVAILFAISVVAVSGMPSTHGILPPGGTFTDDDGNTHEANIEAIAAVGITLGCNPPIGDMYCPAASVTRGQMAAFLNRALDLPPTATDAFVDDETSGFEDDINRLFAAGITRGCNPPVRDRFCPDSNVTREEIAAFLVRAYGYTAGIGDDRFRDDDASPFEDDIDRLAAAGITLGCGPTTFCPDRDVRRDEMASFLARAEGLSPIVPSRRCSALPENNIWNTRVDDLSVHPQSNEYISAIGATDTLHADFGSGVWPPGSNSPIGIPFVEVPADQPDVQILYTAYANESDPGPFPIPEAAPIEGGPDGTGDRHVIVLDRADCTLYELFNSFPKEDGSWTADSGAVYDLSSNALRFDGWTSADAAGLPIYPGLIFYDEVAQGAIDHAIRFTASDTRNTHVWPARHHASSLTGSNLPPMGQRFRLKANFDITDYSPQVQVILRSFKEYGLILADNGSPWYISGAPDSRWDNDMLHEWDDIPGSAFEAVDVSPLMIDPNSGQAAG